MDSLADEFNKFSSTKTWLYRINQFDDEWTTQIGPKRLPIQNITIKFSKFYCWKLNTIISLLVSEFDISLSNSSSSVINTKISSSTAFILSIYII